ncbi:hypothetical protein B0H19DRAFT_1182104 [Mycena capillaripes]|nr:hypothetical protein B0H19DRAFT_1182104 [Mycena capillaripes]
MPPPALPGTVAQMLAVQMAAIVLESLFYGVFLVLVFGMSYVRISSRASPSSTRRARLPIDVSLVVILLLATTHWAITVYCFFSAFLGDGDGGLSAVLGAYMLRLQDLQLTENALTMASMVVGDGILIHRVWVVWSRDSHVILIPVLLWLGMFVTGLVAIVKLSAAVPEAPDMSFRFVNANWILSTVTSVYCTAFLAWRIWQVCRSSAEMRARKLLSVLTVLVESAAIWTSWAILFVALHQSNSPAELTINACVPSLIGIVNTVVHLRVAVGIGAALTRKRSPRQGRGTGTGTQNATHTANREAGTQVALPTLTNNASVFGLSVVSTDLESSEYGYGYGGEYPYPPHGHGASFKASGSEA